MSYNERTLSLIGQLESATSFNSKTNEIEVDDFDKIWEDNLPEGVTREIVSSMSDYRKDMSAATSLVFGKTIINAAKDNNDIGALEVRHSTPDVDFGMSFARPTVKKPTKKHWRNSITSYLGCQGSDEQDGIMDHLAGLWDDADA